MIANFLKDRRGNFAMMTAIAMVPIMGSMATGHRLQRGNAPEADRCSTHSMQRTSRPRGYIVSGATDAEIVAYAKDFFEANLGTIDPTR